VFAEQARAIREQRAGLIRGLQAFGSLSVYPSDANFILFRTPAGQATSIFEGLKSAGILIKNLHGSAPALQDCLRVTVGLPEENAAFLAALQQLL
jgi:histidinol-phosphate aminotransferase